MIFLCCILFAVPTALVLKQPDLSTTIVLCLVFVTVMFTAGIHYKVILGVFAVVVPVAIIFVYLVMQPDQTILSDYQKGRITDFLNKESSVNEGGYQQYYSEMAIGSGQLYGKGYKNNQISSVKNADFIAEQQTDFIFAVIGEEFGFVGTVTVIILLLFISMECLLISHRAKGYFRYNYCCGGRSTAWLTGLYQYWSSYLYSAEYRTPTAVCELWSYITCMFFH